MIYGGVLRPISDVSTSIIFQKLIERWNSEIYDDGKRPTVFEELLRSCLFELVGELERMSNASD